jgi:peroxiredoxin
MSSKWTQIICATVLASLCFGCGNSFEVVGKIEGAKPGKVFLERFSFATLGFETLDSGTVSANGHFKLKGINFREKVFRVVIEGALPLLVINDNNKIEIDYNPKEPLKPEIKGSDATDKLYSFLNGYQEKNVALQTRLSSLRSSADSVKLEEASYDSALNRIGALLNEEEKDVNVYVKSFIEKSESPASACFALMLGASTFQPEELMPLLDHTSDKFKKRNEYAEFKILKQLLRGTPGFDRYYALLNESAPNLAMPDVNGNEIRIDDFKGKYLLVDFWASWCVPCRRENPNLVRAYNKFKGRNFTILGVSLDSDKDSWIKAIETDGLTWNHMSDLEGWNSKGQDMYDFNGIPFNVLIDPQGKIIAHNLRGEALEKKLGEVLK